MQDTEDSSQWSLASVLALTVAGYLLLGALGLNFAIAPGYVSPVFPAAGFAVAILLWSDGRAWPGIWLASFALNLGVTGLYGELDWRTTLVAAGIGAGATLQALAARWLLLRHVGKGWQSMETERDIVRSLMLAGPVASVIAASVGVSALYAAQIVKTPDYLYSWWSWWSGDTLGVLVILPLTLTFLYRSQPLWHDRQTTLVLPMVIALELVAVTYVATSRWDHSEQKAAIQKHGEALAQRLEQRVIAHQEALSALRRLIEVTPDMSYRQFEYFTRITLKDNPDIFALASNPFVLHAQRQAFERSMAQKTGVAGFEIKERNSRNQLVRAADRPEYVAVGFISPLEGNRRAIGFDINSEQLRHDAIQRAKRWGLPVVTAPVRLVQEDRQRVGVLLIHPAYIAATTPDQATSSRRLAGFAGGVIKVDEMIEIATRKSTVPGIVFEVEDAFPAPDRSLLYRSSSARISSDSDYAWETQIPVADRSWTLRVAPTEEFLRQQNHWLTMIVGAGGLALASLLQMLLLVTTGTTAAVQRKVREQTVELQARGDALADRNAQLDALFRLSPDGFVAFAPDGKVRFVNPAFDTMTGIRYDDVVGKGEDVLDAELRSRCEAADSFAGVAACFGLPGAPLAPRTLTLKSPRFTVLSAVGIRSEAASLARILYLHEVTLQVEVDRMKNEFLSHAAHELRTPMTSILGFSEILLKMEVDEATRKDLLETIHRQTLWLVDIINELLDLSRIEARRGRDLKIERVDLADLVHSTVAGVAPGDDRWQLVVDVPPRPQGVMADLAKLRQALTNVIGNAIKYSPDGGEVRIAIAEAPGKVGISVSDQGVGMTAEQLTHLGERFWRADTSGKTPGTGLGLAIVKEILKMLGGSMEVRSKPKAGTTVILWLPADM
ncbi:MAG: CHASE domain-containing protein [Sulfuritalea sp.]|jgi:signal transduction histidine kinase/integral membrane sensor domain MASE1|nr:CHASE domain-containing protein [Sulfuritalea sp.]